MKFVTKTLSFIGVPSPLDSVEEVDVVGEVVGSVDVEDREFPRFEGRRVSPDKVSVVKPRLPSLGEGGCPPSSQGIIVLRVVVFVKVDGGS